jgi:hypothetical protein
MTGMHSMRWRRKRRPVWVNPLSRRALHVSARFSRNTGLL